MSGLVVARKRCRSCTEIKDEDDFQVKERYHDGSPKRRFSNCQECMKLRVRVYGAPRLDVSPLRDWMANRLQQEGVWDVMEWGPVPDHQAPRNIDEIARDWGTSAKRVQDILRGRVSTIGEDYADRVLTMAGVPHFLQILWDLEQAA